MAKKTLIHGFVAPGFEPVQKAFAKNFADGQELGAAFAAAQNGSLIVDLWGGIADRNADQPWTDDTLQLIFSGAKGFLAAAMLILIERGALKLEAPVCTYWPEFHKEEILIRHIVSHTSRLPGIEAPITISELTDDRFMVRLLAEQLPSLDPRARLCYHPLTFGWLCGEVVRRISGQNVGDFVRSEIAAPLGLDVWIGLPEEFESRVSRIELAPDWGTAPFLDPAVWARDPLAQSIWGNPPHFAAETFPWNESAMHRAQIPAANAIGKARSIAKFYSCLASGGSPILSECSVSLGRNTVSDGIEELHRWHRRTGVGFELQTEFLHLGPAVDAFGHGGAGGSKHGAWPGHRVGFSYSMNLMREPTSGDIRAQRLLAALHSCLERQI